ncbi:acyl-CoA desaturase [Frankia sp. CNm7]|uniref:Acyl-CoA desaturase n=2 Tax=Frankia nepalensis TaxID=1836974 RepID=A0A937RLK7_9ACTN|nr:acyl-CoA desaturase [Frankia nepalensis]MBL7497638.1 acyl-CoA desaturase [Frankia nepalensis]MBL7510048.1 acyl-CoA desaturase [Frankia nepalensis]MBL7517542.1 acyl-CoA desaturase [Frankia nepalensis]MBL7631069.1 acyl-CoA desaturase [Frankia nepalensis]
MTAADIDELGRELDQIRAQVTASLGEDDARYIRRIICVQRLLEVGGRATMFASRRPPAWLAGTTMLAFAKILENMEIGHNVMHGQWDWMGDPTIHSTTWEWDAVSPSDQWRQAHNYRHHTYTNVLGKDRDIGFGILRMTPAQRWNPAYLGQPLYNLVLAATFEWGVAIFDTEIDRAVNGEKTWQETFTHLGAMLRKGGRQALKDYLVFPLLAGPAFLPVLLGNLAANVVRNLWAHTIIFCGHFPDGVETFTPEQVERETRGEWYLRQLLGSANIEGSPLFHILSGNLSHQIEHHLFPDLPSNRYAEIAPQVRALCERFGLPYTTGSLPTQTANVWARVLRLALPGQAAAPAIPAPRRPERRVSAAHRRVRAQYQLAKYQLGY